MHTVDQSKDNNNVLKLVVYIILFFFILVILDCSLRFVSDVLMCFFSHHSWIWRNLKESQASSLKEQKTLELCSLFQPLRLHTVMMDNLGAL